jgi:hypothetical protein
MIEENKRAAREVFDVWNGGQLDRLDDLVALNMVHDDKEGEILVTGAA